MQLQRMNGTRLSSCDEPWPASSAPGMHVCMRPPAWALCACGWARVWTSCVSAHRIGRCRAAPLFDPRRPLHSEPAGVPPRHMAAHESRRAA
eukprot:364698-Chlamydomonas_euryale.AAC.5